MRLSLASCEEGVEHTYIRSMGKQWTDSIYTKLTPGFASDWSGWGLGDELFGSIVDRGRGRGFCAFVAPTLCYDFCHSATITPPFVVLKTGVFVCSFVRWAWGLSDSDHGYPPCLFFLLSETRLECLTSLCPRG